MNIAFIPVRGEGIPDEGSELPDDRLEASV